MEEQNIEETVPGKMDETVPGGRYKGANGTWHDANGKPLPADGSAPVAADSPGAGPGPTEDGSEPAVETGAGAQTAEQLSEAEKKTAAKKLAAEKAAEAKKAKAEAGKQ